MLSPVRASSVRFLPAASLVLLLLACAGKEPLLYPTIYEAAEYGDLTDVVRHLERGSIINAREEKTGMTALHYAARAGYPDVVAFLLNNGANSSIRDAGDRIPLYYALNAEHEDIVELLLIDFHELGSSNLSLFFLAAEKGSLKTVEYFLANAADANARDGAMQTALHKAAQYGHKAIAELLVTKSVDVNAQDRVGRTPLHVVGDHAEVAELLLANGADAALQDKNGRTPLDEAISGKRERIVEMIHKQSAHEVRNAPQVQE